MTDDAVAICLMSEKDFEDVVELDKICFNRSDRPRSTENIAALHQNHPKGCFVAKNTDLQAIGYLFTKILGDVAYIGPLGVLPQWQGKGIGKLLIQRAVTCLVDAGCKTIGLEARADAIGNIGLYLSMGFRPVMPTVMFRPKATLFSNFSDELLNINDISVKKIDDFCEKLRTSSGIDLWPDLDTCCRNGYDNIFFTARNGELNGFFAYTPLIYPHGWGGFLPDFSCTSFAALYENAVRVNDGRTFSVRANYRYANLHQLLGGHFEVEMCLIRMLLRDFAGDFDAIATSSIILRSWVS